MLITCSLGDCTYYICILVSLFVGIYVWLNWTTLLFISKFLSSINQSVHPLMIYNHFSSSHHSSHPLPSPSIDPSIHSSPLHPSLFIHPFIHPSLFIYHFIHPLIHPSSFIPSPSIPSPSSSYPPIIISIHPSIHPLITHHHIHLSHSLCWFIWQRGRYAKYNPNLKLGYECCSTDSISFHYLKVVHYLGCVVYRVYIISSYKLL